MPGSNYVFLAVENFGFLALSQFGAEAGARLESRDPRATRTQPLRERALGNELEFKFTRQHLTFELLVLANVRGQDFFYLPCGEQNSHSETIDASVVADNGQALTPLSRNAAIRFSGTPHSPNPPAAIVMLS